MISGVSDLKATVASSRLRNSGVNSFLIASSSCALDLAAAEADGVALGVGGAGVGGHDQDHVAEVDLLAVRVGERAVVHDLQQDVVDVLVRLLDLVEQHDRVRMLVDGVGQEAALVEADIAGRRADQAADGVALHVLAHVEAQQLDAERQGQLPGGLGLAGAGGAGEQVAADRLVAVAQARPRHLHGRGELVDRFFLAEHRAAQVGSRAASAPRCRTWRPTSAGCGRSWRRPPRPPSGRWSSSACLPAAASAGAGLVDDVDRLVRQLAVGDVFRRQLHRRLHRLGGVVQLVEVLVVGLQALEDLDACPRWSAR